MDIKNLLAKDRRGVTLLETIIAVAILTAVAVAIYQSFAVLLQTFVTARTKVTASALANEEMEIVRNMPYVNVGTVGGLPPGSLPQVKSRTKDGITFSITTTIRNVDDPFDGTLGGTPNDLSPSDYKVVEFLLVCTSCVGPNQEQFEFTGRVAPRSLETASTNGALFVQVFDANGQPVSGATVSVANNTVNPAVNLTDTTDTTGFLRLVDVPPAVQSYRIMVSKTGYSSDQTYATSTQNPNPVKRDATVALQTVTQVSFAIDRVSTMNVSSVTNVCAPIASVPFTIKGAKLIGTAPSVYKFSQNYTTDGGGVKSVGNLEWDNYTLTVASATHDLAGTIPYTPLNILPNSTQDERLIMTPKVPRGLLVTVKDAATGLPLSNATAHITATGLDQSLTTGRGFLRQTDWSGGSGQTNFSNTNQYFDQDGNIDTMTPAGDLKLLSGGTNYAPSGILTSSTFDTGSISTFYDITFLPASQPPDTGANSAKFQIATATSTTPVAWNFLGPDGTASTYYTTSNTNINAIHNTDRYLRYRAFLSTASTTFTPSVSDVAVTFASSCVPPGQVFFSGLPADSYNISITRSGYQTVSDVVTVNQSWQEYVALMTP